MMLLSCGAPLMPAGGSCCKRLKSRINLFRDGVDMALPAAPERPVRLHFDGQSCALLPGDAPEDRRDGVGRRRDGASAGYGDETLVSALSHSLSLALLLAFVFSLPLPLSGLVLF